MRRALLVLTFAALVALAVACARSQEVKTEDIVSTVPWPDQERAEYVLLDRDSGEEVLRGVLTSTRTGDQYELSLSFSGEQGSDESTVIVDAATLKPLSIRREQRTDETRVIEGDYDATAGLLQITEVSGDDRRAVPLRLKDHYYDNESSLFLWRTIAFAEDYKASYYTVLASQNTQHVVTLRVKGKEQVTVPAGTFDTWRLEIEAAGRRQNAWFADTPERPLVRYDNTVQLFELTAYTPGE
ncbi:MAG: DUF3108 domain-containing protein [Chloroflexi bacterium]|nr:DUF3108 domain-containing protein [Chloroflexota bacterium]